MTASHGSDFLQSLPILWSDLVRVQPGRPPAGGAASEGYGLGVWDEELWARTAGVLLGTPTRRLGRIHPSFRTDPSLSVPQQVPIGKGVAGGPELVLGG